MFFDFFDVAYKLESFYFAGMDIASLTVFQRTPVWCTRRLMDVEYPQWLKKLFSLVPILLLLQRWTYFWILDLIFFQLVFPPPTWYTRKPQALFREPSILKIVKKEQKSKRTKFWIFPPPFAAIAATNGTFNISALIKKSNQIYVNCTLYFN